MLVLALVLTAAASAQDVITFGTNAEFPPFEFVTAQGVIDEFDGIDMVIAKTIAEENGKIAKISNMEFDSLLIALQSGQIDAVIAGMTITEERKEAVNFTTPYYTATQVMIVKEGSDVKSAADLQGKKIVVVQGYTGETAIQGMGFTPNDYVALKKGSEAIIELLNGKKKLVLEEYVLHYLRSPMGYSELTKFKKATAQESISIDAIRNVIIPIPPLEEQKRIVSKLEELLPLCEQLNGGIK